MLSILMSPAHAQTPTRSFPTHPVRIIVATSAGSGADVMSRLLGQKLSEVWGQPVVIENQSGASGNIGANMVARATADGHVLLMATVNHTINKALTPIKSGRLKALAVTTAKRSSSLPNVPSVAEQGIKGFDVQSWVGLLAPAATPEATVAQIYTDIARVANTPGFIEQMQGQGMELDLKNPAQFKTYIAAEVNKWTRVVQEAGIKP